MTFKKTLGSKLLIILFLVVFLVSCTPAKRLEIIDVAKRPEQSEKIKLRFSSSWGGVDAKADPLQQVLNKFMEDNPDIEVINESIFGEDFLHKLKTDFASGYNPDVFGLWPGSDIRALIKADKVADLTEILEQDSAWKDSFGRSAWDYTTFEGKIYGLPLEIIYECLFINKDLFIKYNVDVPTTYEELKKAVVQFKQSGIVPIAYNYTAEGSYLYQNIVARLGGKSNVEQPFKDGKVNKCYIDAVKYVKELYDMGAFPVKYFKMTSRERDEMFINKNAAMIVQGSWFLGRFDDSDTTIDIVPFPYIEGGNSLRDSLIYGFGCGAFHISKSSWEDDKRRDASLKLLKALTSRETATLFVKQTRMLSNVESQRLNVYQGRLRITERKLINSSKELIGPPDSFVDRSVWEGIIVKDFPYVLAGEKTPEALWEAARKEYIKKGIE